MPVEPLIDVAQVIAVDWSGAASEAAQRRGICAAVCEASGSGMALLPERTRAEVEDWLAKMAAQGEPVVAGLDFSFSYPAWFLRELGCGSAPELWALAERDGERWLREPHAHFWGRRKGSGPPAAHRAPAWLGYRECERAAAVPAWGSRRLPLSSFQIGGAGAVGTGTVRGMPMLQRLRSAGWSVWPFDPPRLPVLVEIYPRALTGPVVKSSSAAREAYLRQARFAGLAAAIRAQAVGSEDAFDALVSGLVMREHAGEFARLRRAEDPVALLEGAIWLPAANAISSERSCR